MIYIVTFILTASFLYVSGKCKGIWRNALVVIALILPCALAGLRDETIGVDVLSYAKWLCRDAQSMGLIAYLKYEASIAGIGWNLFSWFSVRMLGGMAGYLFAIEALCIVPVYLCLRKMAPGREWFGMFIWLLLMYPFSLNGMRQTAAMGFVFYSVVYLVDRRLIQFILMILIATSLHQTAIVALLFYPLAYFYIWSDGANRVFGQWKALVIWGLVFAAFIIAPQIVRLAVVLKPSYVYQLEHLGSSDISLGGLYLLLGMTIAWIAYKRSSGVYLGSKETQINQKGLCAQGMIVCNFFYLVALIGCFGWQLNFIASTLGRLGYYGSMFIALIAAVQPRGEKGFDVSLGVILLVAFGYFLVMNLVLGIEGVAPYTSMILGIG